MRAPQSRGVVGVFFFASSSGGNSPLGRPENIVHQTMKMKIKSAPSASSNNKVMR